MTKSDLARAVEYEFFAEVKDERCHRRSFFIAWLKKRSDAEPNAIAEGTPEYAAFRSARRRCNSPDDPHFKDYGGRGIRFLYADFWQFLADVGRRPEGRTLGGRAMYSIHRIDNNGHYQKGNVKWATQKEQCAHGACRRRGRDDSEAG